MQDTEHLLLPIRRASVIFFLSAAMIQHLLNPLPQGSLLRSTVAVSCCAGP